MGSYGRNFDFRVPPVHGQRGGRYILGGSTDLPIGAPVVVAAGATQDAALTHALPVTLATGAQAPVKGRCGILVYEWIDLHYLDPEYYNFSDRDTAPHGKMVQVVHGDAVKVVFKNTADREFLHTRTYQGRVMVAGLGATPTLAIGDYLSPGTGDDDSGYWAESNAANGWLVVEQFDAARGEVECRFNF